MLHQWVTLKHSFRKFEGIISGTLTHVAVDQKSQLSRIVRDVRGICGNDPAL